MKKYNEDYSGFVNPPTSAYPYGSPKNATTDTAEDGTPVEEGWVSDAWGFFQSAVDEAGITPNGQAESVANPQILNAIKSITDDRFNYDGLVYGGVGNISDFAGQQLQESEKTNAYQYPDNSRKFYAADKSQAFPITIPADPTTPGSGWVLVNSVTTTTVGSLTNYEASSISNMLQGIAIGGIQVQTSTTQSWRVSGYYALNDGGAGDWQKTSTVKAPNQSPSQLGKAEVTDANGNVWTLKHSGTINIQKLGAQNNQVVSEIANAAVSSIKDFGGGDVFYPPFINDSETNYLADNVSIEISSLVVHRALNHNVCVKLADNSNLTDYIFKTTGFDSLLGQGKWLVSDGVQHGCGFGIFRIDGNKDNQTNAVAGVGWYAKRLICDDLIIHDCKGRGWYSEAGDIAGQQGWEDYPEGDIGVYIRKCDGDNMLFRGPHDARFRSLVSNESGARGVAIQRDPGVYSGACDIDFAHIYANQQVGFTSNASAQFRSSLLISESNFAEGVIIESFQCQVSMLQLYNNCRTSGSYNLVFAGGSAYNTISNLQIRDDQGAGGVFHQGNNNTIGGGNMFGTAAISARAINVAGSTFNNRTSCKVTNFSEALRVNSDTTCNTYNLDVNTVDVVMNIAQNNGLGNRYDICYTIDAGKVISGMNGPTIKEDWFVRGTRGDIYEQIIQSPS